MLKPVITAAATAAGVLLPVTSASAWSVERTLMNGKEVFQVTAAAGETNTTSLQRLDAVTLRFGDSGGAASTGAGCTAAGAFAQCGSTGPGTAIAYILGDKNDVALVGDGLGDGKAFVNVDGGGGNDRLSNQSMAGTISGSDGTDILRPGGGDDFVSGGAGLDAVDYSERAGSVKVFLAQDQALPAAGEQDELTGIEAVFTGAGDDILTGSGGDEQFIPGDGKDNLMSGGGKDVVDARDGFKDTIDCGPGTDTLYADQLDSAPKDCETVQVKHTLAGGGLQLKGDPPAPHDLPAGESGAPAETTGAGTDVDRFGGPAARTTPSSSGADRTAPALRGLMLSRSVVRRRGPKARRATTLRFTLSERADVTIAVERCVVTRRRTKRCALPTRVTSLRRRGLAGAVSLKLTAQLPERTLRVGRYRLKVTATDAAGNRSTPATTLLTVKR